MKIYPPYAPMEVVKGFQDQDNLILRESSPVYDSCYLDPRSDFAFKYIFGKEGHKDVLIDFLNSLFEGRKVIRDLQFSPTEHSGKKKETRKVLFDLLCTGDHGERFLVEKQRDRQDFFPGRVLHYACRINSEQYRLEKKGMTITFRRFT